MKTEMSNPVIESIYNRRSCRDFKAEPISKEIINTIIDAGNQAPFTSMNRSQPWRFIVVEDAEFKQKLIQTTTPIWKQSIDQMKEMAPEIYETAMNLYETMDEPKDMVYYSAPTIIFVIGPKRNAICCSMACENMMIAATSLGLGSCYVGFGGMVTGNQEILSTFNITDDETIYGPILIGYPKEESNSKIADGLAQLAPQKKESVVQWI